MSWQTKLQYRTRQPEFLWRMAIVILLTGVGLGYAGQWLPQEMRLSTQRYTEYFESLTQLEHHANHREWASYWWEIPQAIWHRWMPVPVLIAGVTGLSWFVFVLQAGQPGAPRGIRWPLVVAAIPLGVLSVWPTLFFSAWQEEVWNLRPSNEFASGIRYYLLSVGLREEFCKLLLFLPLVPWIVKRGSEREALLVAAAVGLGFAVEENVGYFLADSSDSLGRFLTANFLHMSLTGLTGLALCRACWYPRERGPEALAIFLTAVIVHGLFDAVQVIPTLGNLAFGTFVIFVGLAYQFFEELKREWQPRGETISLSATIVAASSLVTAVSFATFATTFDFQTALNAIPIPAVSMGLMVYVFLRNVPESLIDV